MFNHIKSAAMRTLAVLLLAWPASFALTQLYLTGDFYWVAVGLGAPLLAWSLLLQAAQIAPSESVVVWHSHRLTPPPIPPWPASYGTYEVVEVADEVGYTTTDHDVPFDLPEREAA
jgi:TusA-related sulfurtransferase